MTGSRKTPSQKLKLRRPEPRSAADYFQILPAALPPRLERLRR